jgi:hypothetical protein
MPLNLQQLLVTGELDYIAKHNSNYSLIEGFSNTLENDVGALKAAGAPGADLDFRLGAFNVAINGTFDYWQRGTNTRPDGWKIENDGGSFTVNRSTEKKLNTYSALVANQGRLTQKLPTETLNNLSVGFSFALVAWVKSDAAARIGIYDGITNQFSTAHLGDDTWRLLSYNYIHNSATVPSQFKILLDNPSDNTYFNNVTMIKGNPTSGALPIANDPSIEKLRVLSLYEIGTFNMSGGMGYKNGNDRIMIARVPFCVPKTDTPIITLNKTMPTPDDLFAINVDDCGFDIQATKYSIVGNANEFDGFNIDNIAWTAEVNGY